MKAAMNAAAGGLMTTHSPPETIHGSIVSRSIRMHVIC